MASGRGGAGRCERCGHRKSRYYRARQSTPKRVTYRLRRCLRCSHEWWTWERPGPPPPSVQREMRKAELALAEVKHPTDEQRQEQPEHEQPASKPAWADTLSKLVRDA